MGLFDDVLKPGQGAEVAVKRELELRRSKWSRPGYHYKGGADFLLQHGKSWMGRELPEQYDHLVGPETHCFGNALAAAEADPSLRYVEGYYIAGGFGHARNHAWCIDQDDQVVELTLGTRDLEGAVFLGSRLPPTPPETWIYYGTVFDARFVRSHAESLGLPMFDRPLDDIISGDPGRQDGHDFPLLKVRFDPARTSL